MQFQHRVAIQAGQPRVWQFLLNVPEVGRCVPGVTDVQPLGGSDYAGTMKVRIGPVALNLQGKLSVIEQDEAAGRAVLRGEAADRRAGGSVNVRIELRLDPKSPTETDLLVTTDANVLGKLGEFGQPLIRRKADQTMDEFARNIQRALA